MPFTCSYLWVPPLVPVKEWGRSCAGGKSYQFVFTRGASACCIALYREPFTSFFASELFPMPYRSVVTFQEVRAMAESMLERLLRGAHGSKVGQRSTDAAMAKKWPSLSELMTVLELPGGEVRKPSSLLIFAEDGLFKGCLTERDLDISLWASAPSFLGVMDSLEERLGQETVEWRKKSPRGGKAK